MEKSILPLVETGEYFMMGSILSQLQVYMVERLGADGWKDLLAMTGLPRDKTYYSIQFYPDDELDHIMDSASIKLSLSKESLYRDVGREFGKYLIKSYGMMFLPSWKTMDIIDKISPKVYKILQLIDPKTPKSEVRTHRISPNEVMVYYKSPRKMCAFIMGVYEFVAEHFHENIKIKHTTCMHHGAPECEIHITLVTIPTFAQK